MSPWYPVETGTERGCAKPRCWPVRSHPKTHFPSFSPTGSAGCSPHPTYCPHTHRCCWQPGAFLIKAWVSQIRCLPPQLRPDVEHLEHCCFLMIFLIIGCKSSNGGSWLGGSSFPHLGHAVSSRGAKRPGSSRRCWRGEGRGGGDKAGGQEGTSKASWPVIGNAYIPEAGEGAGRCWDQSVMV